MSGNHHHVPAAEPLFPTAHRFIIHPRRHNNFSARNPSSSSAATLIPLWSSHPCATTSPAKHPNTHTMTTENSTTDNNSVTIDLYSVYYLHPSDQPGQILVTPQLNGGNYPTWSRGVQLALEAKNKLGFLDGSTSKPDEKSPLLSHWNRCNRMVHSWLLHSTEASIRSNILWAETTHEHTPASVRRNQLRRYHCDHCDIDDHSNSRCWVLHPELKQNRNQSSSRSTPSHPIHHNTGQSRLPTTAATVAIVQSNSAASNLVASSVHSPTLTPEQISQLLALIQPGKIAHIQTSQSYPKTASAASTTSTPFNLWHWRLGHPAHSIDSTFSLNR
ncbi:hypothetical protein BUALT_Bualt14G0121600 [Buddleja alternifolia]|uniref:Retrotransposon Copia-like N-terminal domain-containing protein n=1 Tax=Buddleja alternifolia TaxID=168488 RepID=A0AAV6WIB0_9LAMI|nr:hypothetical protein BUALT_Bualt14G0121600 [Buddleja alternifolia]